MTVLEQVALGDEQQPTPAYEQYRQQRGATRGDHVIPRGTYEAELLEVNLVRRKDGSGFVLRLIARTIGLGKYVIAWRGLTGNPLDPYDLTENEVRSFRKYATSMGINVPAPAAEIVARLEQFAVDHVQVEAKVAHTPAGIQTVISRLNHDRGASSSTALTVAGRVIDVNGQLLDDGRSLEGAARVAQEAHVLLLGGLGQVRKGIRQTAEACHRLKESEGWRALGYESVSEYLASPEITLSKQDFYGYADIWQTYVLDGGADPRLLEGAGQSKLEVPLPALKQGLVDAERAAADAESMSRRDLRERYRELLGGLADEGTDPASPAAGNGSGEGAAASEPESRRRDDDPESGSFDADDLVRWAESYGHPEEWAKKAQDLHSKVDGALADVLQAREAAEQLQDQLAEIQTRAEATEERERALRAQLEERPHQTDLQHMALAQGLVDVLDRVLREVGNPARRQMSKDLRAAVVAALDAAREQGLAAE